MLYSSWLHCVKNLWGLGFQEFLYNNSFDVLLSCRYAKNVYMIT